MGRALPTIVITACLAACSSERGPSGPVSRTRSPTPPSVSTTETPEPGSSNEVEKVRAKILTAVRRGDYESLRPVLNQKVFLSDFGFGKKESDVIDRWSDMGDEPLEIMGALLQMKYEEEETNEGHLFRWPRYDENTKSLAEISNRDRKAFRSVMSEREFKKLVPNAEFGYVGPRIGILEDGTWWFFVLEDGP